MCSNIKHELSDKFKEETTLQDITQQHQDITLHIMKEDTKDITVEQVTNTSIEECEQITFPDIKIEPVEMLFEDETMLTEYEEISLLDIKKEQSEITLQGMSYRQGKEEPEENYNYEKEEMTHPEVDEREEITLNSSNYNKDTLDSNNKYKLNHTENVTIKCDTCGQIFSTFNNLNKHKLIHTGVKLYLCDMCGQTFTQFVSLKSHKLTHSGVKAYECNICRKTFTHSSGLNKHIKLQCK